MFCSRPAATMRKRRNTWAMASIAGRFRSSSATSLKSAAGVPTYRDLFARTSALLSAQVGNQSPQLEATQNDDLDATFLDGAIQPAPATFTASYQQGHWIINGGATSGIPAPSGSDAARLALYPFDAPAADSVRSRPRPWRWPRSTTSFPRPADSPSRRRPRSIRRRRTRPSSSACRRLRCTCFWTVMPRAAPWSARP